MLKKILKITGYILGTLLVIVAVLLVVALKKTDKTPYFKTEYYQQTVDNLNAALEGNPKVTGQLHTGFGKVNITPELVEGPEDPLAGKFNVVPMSGFGDREGPANGVHDSLYVKATAIQVADQLVVSLSADILLIPPYVADSVAIMLKEKLGISREQLFFGATHTHSGIGATTPGWVGEKFSGAFQPGIISFLSHRFTEAAVSAVEDLKPASFSSQELRVPQLVRNRMSGENGRLNDVLTRINFHQKEGRNALIGTYAAHSTTLGDKNLKFSGDYPGYWQRKLEEELVDHAQYYAGTLGSHSHRGEGSDFERARFMGENLAMEMINRNWSVMTSDTVDFQYFSIRLKHPHMQFRVKKNLALRPWLGHKLIPADENIFFQGMRIGNTVWISVPFELSGEIAIDVKNALKLNGFHSLFTSFNGAYLGYITPSKYYYDETYESFLMGWYGPSMGDYVTDLLYKACDGLTGERL